jgi:hypothetical protein
MGGRACTPESEPENQSWKHAVPVNGRMAEIDAPHRIAPLCGRIQSRKRLAMLRACVREIHGVFPRHRTPRPIRPKACRVVENAEPGGGGNRKGAASLLTPRPLHANLWGVLENSATPTASAPGPRKRCCRPRVPRPAREKYVVNGGGLAAVRKESRFVFGSARAGVDGYPDEEGPCRRRAVPAVSPRKTAARPRFCIG